MDELAKRFADLAEKYGSNTTDAALGAARVEAFSSLTKGVLLIFIGGIFLWCARYLWRKWHNEGWDEITLAPFIIYFALGATLISFGIWALLDPWTWVALNHPELWLAKKAFRM